MEIFQELCWASGCTTSRCAVVLSELCKEERKTGQFIKQRCPSWKKTAQVESSTVFNELHSQCDSFLLYKSACFALLVGLLRKCLVSFTAFLRVPVFKDAQKSKMMVQLEKFAFELFLASIFND